MSSAAKPARKLPGLKYLGWFFGLAAIVVALDQGAKITAIANLSPNQYYPFLGDLLRLYLVYNDSAAFSLSLGSTAIFTVISSLATIALIWWAPRIETRSWSIIAGLVLGGVVGNLIDRLFREPGFGSGHVVDYLSLPFNFPIFNIADMAISITAVVVVLRVMRGENIGKAKTSASKRPEQDA